MRENGAVDVNDPSLWEEPRAGGSASSPTAPIPSTRSRSSRSSSAISVAAAGCSTWAAAKGRWRAARRPGRRRGRARPHCGAAGGGPGTGPWAPLCAGVGRRPAVPHGRVRRSGDVPRDRAPRSDGAGIHEIARVLEPGGRFLLLLNHPLLQAPGQRLDRRPDPRGAVLAGRALPVGGDRPRGVGPRRQVALHAPPAEPIYTRDG